MILSLSPRPNADGFEHLQRTRRLQPWPNEEFGENEEFHLELVLSVTDCFMKSRQSDIISANTPIFYTKSITENKKKFVNKFTIGFKQTNYFRRSVLFLDLRWKNFFSCVNVLYLI